MTLLHIETSSKNCSVSISHNSELLCLCEKRSLDYKQSENLHQFVSWALEGAQIGFKDLDAIVLGKGPGSYTGLRIGASAAKGFCFALNLPLIGVQSLESMIPPVMSEEVDVIIPLIDARRMEVYTSVYDGKTGQKLEPTTNLILSENSFSEYQDKKVLFVGDGAKKAKEILRLPNAKFDEEIYPSAKYMITQAEKKFKNKEFEDVAYFEPFYLKEFQGIKKGEESKKP